MKLKFLIFCIVTLTITATAQIDDGEEVFELDDGMEIEIVVEDDDAIDKMPEITEFVDAQYPEELADEGVAGIVLLELIVSETGSVDSVWVVRPLHPLLDALALDAASRFKFSPAEVNGEPVAVMLQYEYAFTPPKPETAPSGENAGGETVAADTTAAAGDDAHNLDDAYELTVYGREEVKEVAHHRISISEVRRLPGLGGDAARAVQAMPGVARPAFGGSEVAVRGAPGWASRYFLDGMSVPLLYHVAGTSSIYPSEAIEGVDFFPGGFSSRYGGAVGGVIEMKPRRSRTDRLRGYADLSMLNGEVFIEGPINESVAFMAAGRRGFAGDLLNLYFKITDPDAKSASLAPFYWDYLLRADIAINENNHLYVSLLGSRDSIGVFIPGMDRGSVEIDGELDRFGMMIMFHSIMLGLDSRLSDRWENRLRLSLTYAESRMAAFGMLTINEKPYIGHMRNEFRFKANEALTVNIGADIELLNHSMVMTMNSGQNIIVRDTMDNILYGILGGYMSFEWRPTERLLVIPSIRYDCYPELNYFGSLVPPFWEYGIIDNRQGLSGEPAFRLSGRYQVAAGHTAKAAVGTYSKTPEPMGMVTHDIWGEPDMPATKATQYVAGYEWQISDLLNLDVQTYLNRMWDVPRMYNGEIDFDPERTTGQRNMMHDGRDRTYGLELMLRRARSDKFFGWISYTLSRSETWSKADGRYILSSRDEPHHLQLLGSWKLPKNYEFGVRTRFVSGKPTSPIVGTVEDENDKRIRPVYGENNSTRHDPFFQVDLRLDKALEREKYKLSFSVDLQNVFWPLYKSPEITFWNYNYTEKMYIGMIPMISTGIRLEF